MLLKDGREATIRPVRMSDARDLQAVDSAIVRADIGVIQEIADIRPTDHVRARIASVLHREDLLLVAVIDGTVVGSLDVTRLSVPSLRHNGALTMGVHPSAQGLGLGRALVEAGMDWCADHGVERIELYCLANNHRALRLYESVGFRRVHLRTGFVRRADGRVEDDWILEWTA